jgi:ABC-type transporter Mla subunit MlaD
LSKSEQATAQKYSKLLNQKDPIKNLNNIADEIAKQDDAVGAFLDKNNKVFNPQDLKSSLNESLKDLTDVTVDEKVVLKGKQKLIDNFIKNLKQNDMKTLWTARKEFDQQIEKAFTGSRTLQNKLKTEFRNSVQKFIGDNTPDTVYSDAMKEMSNLYKVKDLLKFKAAVEKGNSAVVLWIKNNPIKAKAIGLGIPGVVGSAMLLN